MKSLYFRGETEILFPHWAVPQLRGLRDGEWGDLVEYISCLPETHEDSLAFSLMMIRHCGCVGCNPGAYRATLGCATCSQRTIAIAKRSERGLVQDFQRAQDDVKDYLEGEAAATEAAAGEA
ncbi:MAG: hypothetical protein ACE5NC_00335 [Anaerolineae bacterium]